MTLKQLLSFDYKEIKNRKTNSIKLTLLLFAYTLLIHLLSAISKAVLSKFELIESGGHPTASLIKENGGNVSSLIIIFILSVVIHPITEEISFRLAISKNKRWMSLGIGSMIVFLFLIITKIYEDINLNDEVAFYLLYFGLTIPISFLIFISLRTVGFSVSDKNISVLVPISCLLFAISHLHVINQTNSYIAEIILFLPFFLNGYLLAYIRVASGFSYCILLHILNNLFFYLLNLIFS